MTCFHTQHHTLNLNLHHKMIAKQSQFQKNSVRGGYSLTISVHIKMPSKWQKFWRKLNLGDGHISNLNQRKNSIKPPNLVLAKIFTLKVMFLNIIFFFFIRMIFILSKIHNAGIIVKMSVRKTTLMVIHYIVNNINIQHKQK